MLLSVRYIVNLFTTFRLCDYLTDLCRKSLPGRAVHSDATNVAFETLKARIISAPVLLIPISSQEAEFVVATDAIKVGIAGVLLQKDSDGHLKRCA